jgi:hypothetical protein
VKRLAETMGVENFVIETLVKGNKTAILEVIKHIKMLNSELDALQFAELDDETVSDDSSSETDVSSDSEPVASVG